MHATVHATVHAQISVLGPIGVTGPAGTAELSGVRQRALVGLLAVRAPALVPRALLIDALWGEDPPRTAVKTLQSHVARVRQALDRCGLRGALVTRDPGYLLDLSPETVDAHRFEAAVSAAQAELAAGEPARAVAILREHLTLWRGDAFADAEPVGWAAAEVDRLREARATGYATLWDAELRLGRHVAAVSELERLLVAYPNRERLVGLLMLALYRSGRPAEALAAYRRLQEHLADELGTDPGRDLQRLHVEILRGDPALDGGPEPTGPVPAQLPAPAGHFVGRDGELATLHRLLTADSGTRTVVVCGLGGIGKTALAVHFGHSVRDRFPDGQIFLDLRGDGSPAPMTPAGVLAHALESLGVPAARVPAEPDGQVGLYRSLLRGRRVLIVADNAGTAEQVLPLVPATDTALLLVTARSRLTALATRHAVGVLPLDALDHPEAVTLLDRLLGDPRVAREPHRAADLVELCGRMPLAVRIAAAKLTLRPRAPIGTLVAELARDNPLDSLAVEGDARSLRAVFASSYRMLTEPAARTFRLLCLHPGPTVTVALAAALTAMPIGAATRAVDELAAAHLITEESAGRYRFHDLIRVYGAEVGEERGATDRLLDWYRAVVGAANRIVDPGRDRVTPAPPAEPPFPPEPAAALSFLDGERDNLLPIVRYAAEHGYPVHAWQLTYLLTGFFDSRGHWGERIEMCRYGVAAAHRVPDPAAEGLMRSALGVAYSATRRWDEALPEFQQALDLMRSSADLRGEAHVYNNIAVVYAAKRRFDEAIEAYHAALHRHSTLGSKLGVALTLNNIGDSYVRMGRPELGLEHLCRAHALSREVANPRLEAITLGSLGQAYQAQGRYPEAVDHLGRSLALRRRIGDRRTTAETVHNLGLCHLAAGDHTLALQHFTLALAASREIANLDLEALVLHNFGQVHLRQRDLTAARGYLETALALRVRVPDPYQTAAIHRDLRELAELADRPGEAAEHRARAIAGFRAANAPAEAEALAAPAPAIATEARP